MQQLTRSVSSQFAEFRWQINPSYLPTTAPLLEELCSPPRPAVRSSLSILSKFLEPPDWIFVEFASGYKKSWKITVALSLKFSSVVRFSWEWTIDSYIRAGVKRWFADLLIGEGKTLMRYADWSAFYPLDTSASQRVTCWLENVS